MYRAISGGVTSIQRVELLLFAKEHEPLEAGDVVLVAPCRQGGLEQGERGLGELVGAEDGGHVVLAGVGPRGPARWKSKVVAAPGGGVATWGAGRRARLPGPPAGGGEGPGGGLQSASVARPGSAEAEGHDAPSGRSDPRVPGPLPRGEEVVGRGEVDGLVGHLGEVVEPGLARPAGGNHGGRSPGLPQFGDEGVQEVPWGVAPVVLHCPRGVGEA